LAALQNEPKPLKKPAGVIPPQAPIPLNGVHMKINLHLKPGMFSAVFFFWNDAADYAFYSGCRDQLMATF
jgi:hypothetical protein